jgi:hypothetical protein
LERKEEECDISRAEGSPALPPCPGKNYLYREEDRESEGHRWEVSGVTAL